MDYYNSKIINKGALASLEIKKIYIMLKLSILQIVDHQSTDHDRPFHVNWPFEPWVR